MATIAEQLTSLANTKTAIKDAIVAKGVAVADTDPFSAYAGKIGQISGGGGAPATKYGISIDNLLGNVDENGILKEPTESFVFDGAGIKKISYNSGLKYKFYYNQQIKSAIFSELEEVGSGPGFDLESTFYGSAIETLDMGNLISITGGSSVLSSTCYACPKLTTVIVTSLREITSSLGLKSTFRNCTGLTKFYFPSLIIITNANAMGTGSASYTFQGCTNLVEIHFRADAQAVIESLTGYANKFGATNATIYFDL